MRGEDFLRRLKSGRPVLGVCSMLPGAGLLERMCKGWDFVWIDTQHGLHDYTSVAEAIRVADGMGVATVLRPYSHDDGLLCKFADLRPTVMMVPMVNTAAQAKDILAALRFAPAGRRSYGGRRVIDLDGRDYYKFGEPIFMPQIETAEGVRNAADIAAVDGADILFFGPDDMRVSLGLPINTPILDDEKLRRAAEDVGRAAKAAGKCGAFVAVTPPLAEFACANGYQLLVCGADVSFLGDGAVRRLAEIQGAVSPKGSEPVSY